MHACRTGACGCAGTGARRAILHCQASRTPGSAMKGNQPRPGIRGGGVFKTDFEPAGLVLLAPDSGVGCRQSRAFRLPERFKRRPVEIELLYRASTGQDVPSDGLRTGRHQKIIEDPEVSTVCTHGFNIDPDQGVKGERKNHLFSGVGMAEGKSGPCQCMQCGLAARIMRKRETARITIEHLSERQTPQRMCEGIRMPVRVESKAQALRLLRRIENRDQLGPLRRVNLRRNRSPDLHFKRLHQFSPNKVWRPVQTGYPAMQGSSI